MKNLLEKMGLSFARAFGATLVILIPGVLAAPDLATKETAAIAMLFAALAAGFKALQVLAPQISFASFVPQPYAAWLDSFTRAFLGAFITAMVSFFSVVNLDWNTAKAALVAVLVGAVAAGFRALQGLLTKGETPAVTTGA